jgi:Uma2 family endonuclease
MTWRELCEDRRFQDLPFKIELNRQGQIIMSPTRNYHGFFGYRIGRLLEERMISGRIIVECAVDTNDGTKEADVAWVSDERWQIIKDQYSSSVAPEICVEVLSPSNTLAEMMVKKDLYLMAGAKEYWLCDAEGHMQFLDGTGFLSASKLCPGFPAYVGPK